MKKIGWTLLVTLFIYGDCSKDDGPSASTTYQPMSANSTWNYTTRDISAGTVANFTLTATGRDSTVNGTKYKVFTRSGGSNEYYAQSGTDYFQFGLFEAVGQEIELNYLKAGGAMGSTWEETKSLTLSGVTINVKFTFTLAEKEINYTVGSTNFTKVNRVNLVLSAPGLPITSQNINFFYAQGVGRIFTKVQLSVPLAGLNANSETALNSYTIQP